MAKRVIITFEDNVIKKLDEIAKKVGMTRNAYVVQICRKQLGFPHVFKEAEG